MSEPIKADDVCDVVGGLGRSKSPNIGKRVTVISMRGDHSKHGRVWRCAGNGIMQLSDTGAYVETGWADFPVTWLRKLPPESLPPVAATKKRELTS